MQLLSESVITAGFYFQLMLDTSLKSLSIRDTEMNNVVFKNTYKPLLPLNNLENL